jgi:hypothetical protein
MLENMNLSWASNSAAASTYNIQVISAQKFDSKYSTKKCPQEEIRVFIRRKFSGYKITADLYSPRGWLGSVVLDNTRQMRFHGNSYGQDPAQTLQNLRKFYANTRKWLDALEALTDVLEHCIRK